MNELTDVSSVSLHTNCITKLQLLNSQLLRQLIRVYGISDNEKFKRIFVVDKIHIIEKLKYKIEFFSFLIKLSST